MAYAEYRIQNTYEIPRRVCNGLEECYEYEL